MADSCLAKEYPMFNDIDNMNEEDISYATSDLRKVLNGEVLDRFPKEIKDRMVAVNADGDMLRIPTECEIFGKNVYGQEESKLTKRWWPMKVEENRIVFQGERGSVKWYWLMNRCKDYASRFAHVTGNGIASYAYVSYSHGIRPVFCLSNM